MIFSSQMNSHVYCQELQKIQLSTFNESVTICAAICTQTFKHTFTVLIANIVGFTMPLVNQNKEIFSKFY